MSHINILDDDGFQISPSEDSVIITPKYVMYRGYMAGSKNTDTFKKYPNTRPLFFGSYKAAYVYAIKNWKGDRVSRQRMGPIYRFQPKHDLNLLVINKETIKQLLSDFKGNNVVSAQLIVAFGYLYDPDGAREIMEHLPPTQKELVDQLSRMLDGILEKCDEKCFTAGARRGECVKFCYYSLKSFGRDSYYAIDKPLMITLQSHLLKKGYQGIFSWVDKKLSNFNHEFIIFHFHDNLESDGVNVSQCRTPKLSDCPLRRPSARESSQFQRRRGGRSDTRRWR